jgi:hypothetical protein
VRSGSALLALLLSAVGPGIAAAQAEPSALHAAWLREVLDLDLPAATAAYARIAADPGAPWLDRQVAIARAHELHRLQVPVVPLPPLDPLPAALRTQFAEVAPPPDLTAVLAAAAGDAATLRPVLAEHHPALQQLRPLVPLVLGQNRPNGASETRMLDWFRASEILRAELDGRADDAQRLRALAFPDWRQRPWPTDHQAAVQRVQQNLEQWLQERELTVQVQSLLRRLRVALQRTAASDAGAALALLDRLPLYGDRLRAGVDR